MTTSQNAADFDTTQHDREAWMNPVSKRLAFDIIGGVILPVGCLIADPIVFRGSIDNAILGRFVVIGYGAIGLFILSLSLWLAFKPWPSVFAGILAAGAVYAFGLGLVLLPFSLIGLMMLIGVFGLTPFFTAVVFWYNAKEARKQAGNGFRPVIAACACLFAMALPVSVQVYSSKAVSGAVDAIAHGTPADSASAVRNLKLFQAVIDTDEIVWAYDREKDAMQKQQIAAAYLQITGRAVEDRLERLLD